MLFNNVVRLLKFKNFRTYPVAFRTGFYDSLVSYLIQTWYQVWWQQNRATCDSTKTVIFEIKF